MCLLCLVRPFCGAFDQTQEYRCHGRREDLPDKAKQLCMNAQRSRELWDDLLARESGAVSLGFCKAVSGLGTSQPRIQVGSKIGVNEVQKNFDLRRHVRANSVQSAGHYRFWLPTSQDGHEPLGDTRFESQLQRQDSDPRIIQHQLPMHQGIVC
jgi:hypothetical protein